MVHGEKWDNYFWQVTFLQLLYEAYAGYVLQGEVGNPRLKA